MASKARDVHDAWLVSILLAHASLVQLGQIKPGLMMASVFSLQPCGLLMSIGGGTSIKGAYLLQRHVARCGAQPQPLRRAHDLQHPCKA